MAATKLTSFRISPELKLNFKRYQARSGYTMSDVLRFTAMIVNQPCLADQFEKLAAEAVAVVEAEKLENAETHDEMADAIA